MNYDGDIEAEAAIVKIALCGKYQQMYSTLQGACQRAGLYPIEIQSIKKWKYHNIGNPTNEIDRLFYFFQFEETERYNKAVYLYTNNKK